MAGGAGRHAELAEELTEWWEDLWQRGTTSRVVLIAVPPGWGRTTALDHLEAAATADDAPVTLVARINARELSPETGIQAAIIRGKLATAAARHPVAEMLGLDRAAGITQLALGCVGLLISGLAAAIGFLVAGIAVGVAGKAWDDSPAGQDGALARTARAVAAASTQAPVVVIIDDADYLDEDLALALVDNLVARADGHVLVAAAVNPAGTLQRTLASRSRQGAIQGLVHLADADPDMSYAARAILADQILPQLPAAAARKIASMTVTFADVFAVTAAPRLAELAADGKADEANVLAAIDAAAARLRTPDPTPEAVITAWAGGLLHAAQSAAALNVLGQPPALPGDPYILRTELGALPTAITLGLLKPPRTPCNDPGGPHYLVRVTAPDSPRLAALAANLADRDRHAMAAALLDGALRVTTDPDASLVEQAAAAQAAHHIRGDLADRTRLPHVQYRLAAALEQLDEFAAALQVITTALDELPPDASPADRDHLAAAALRLTALSPAPASPLAEQLITEAAAHGAGLGLEARTWAAVELLRTSGQRQAALSLAGQVAAAVDEHANELGPAADHWRILLAYHVGKAGQPALTQQLLAPLLTSGDHQREDAARAVLHASAGPDADTRLQNTLLEAELTALPPDAHDDHLRIHHALARNHGHLGQYPQALTHAQRELDLRTAIQGPDHPDTLATRAGIANWTGHSGDPEGALRLFRELLPDLERVLGPTHPSTLSNRGNIAVWTGASGDIAEALRLARELLPDEERILGHAHPDTLITRANIANWAGHSGDPAGAARLYRELLPDMARAVGPAHPDTLNARANTASWAGQSGDPASALRLNRELLPDLERILGPSHPSTHTIRNNIAVMEQAAKLA
jgi:tetratricopeptide (TPR) repeat protein